MRICDKDSLYTLGLLQNWTLIQDGRTYIILHCIVHASDIRSLSLIIIDAASFEWYESDTLFRGDLKMSYRDDSHDNRHCISEAGRCVVKPRRLFGIFSLKLQRLKTQHAFLGIESNVNPRATEVCLAAPRGSNNVFGIWRCADACESLVPTHNQDMWALRSSKSRKFDGLMPELD